MQTTRNTLETNPGSADWFSGPVFVDAIAAHIAIQQAGLDGNVATWGAHVNDDGYEQAPTLEGGDR